MTVKLIKIRNVLGVSDIEFAPGKVTEISGRNATGKTSILNAIRSVARVGSDATLLRAGEEQGEVVLVLDDDTEIGRKFTEARTYPYARQGKMNASSPASFIANLTGQYALNPIDFIMADDKKRIEYLLSCIQLDHDFETLEKITGITIPEDDGLSPLEMIDALRKQLYDQRTGINRALKESEAAVSRLEKSLPENVRGPEELKAERNMVVQEVNTIMAAAKDKLAEATKDAAKAADEIDWSIAKLQEQIDKLTTDKGGLRATLADAKTEIQSKATKDTAELRERVTRLESQIEDSGRLANTLQIIADTKLQAKKLDKEAKVATKRLVQLDQYKAQQLSALPISDLTVTDGKLLVGELPFDQINMAEKLRIAFELARIQAGGLGLVCVDGVELLDRAHYDELIERANNSDVQLIITAVTNDDLTIKT
jgi:DNA repair exonuclease SbcCD ATPase subunit